MDVFTLLSKALDWGPSALSTIVIVLISYLIKQMQKNTAADASRTQELKEYVAVQIKILKEEIEKRLDDQGRRISCLEMESLKKDEFYRENSGWRTELNRLSDQLTNQLLSFTKQIIELWKKG